MSVEYFLPAARSFMATQRCSAALLLALLSGAPEEGLAGTAPRRDNKAGRGRGTAALQWWINALIRLKLLFTTGRCGLYVALTYSRSMEYVWGTRAFTCSHALTSGCALDEATASLSFQNLKKVRLSGIATALPLKLGFWHST